MKKFATMAISVALIGTMIAGGSLAYLQDTDSDVNVMTLGNVKIVQNEQERVETSKLPTEDGNLQAFTQEKPLYPAVFDGTSIPWNTASVADQAWKVVETNSNVVDKFATVTNTGKSPAYVRTIIAYEGDATYGPEGAYIHIVHNGDNVNPAINVELLSDAVEIDGVKYTAYAYTYPTALEPGKTTIPSLKQVYMNKAADNAVVETYGDTYDILVLSQAVQTAGFDNAAAALTAAFPYGDDKAAKIAEWFGEAPVKTSGDANVPPEIAVSTADELEAALEAGGSVYLTEDVTVTATMNVAAGKDVVINLNGNDISYAVSNSGASAIINNKGTLDIVGEGTISFVAENPDLGAIPAYATNTITNTGTLTIGEGVTVTNGSEGGASYAVDNHGKFILDGGTLIGDRCALRVAKYNQDNVEFIMNSGTVKAKTPAWIQLPGSDANTAPNIKVTINGGKFESTKDTSAADNNVLYTYSYGNSHANTSITINGGEFLGGTVSIGSGYKGDAPTLKINGGTFEYDVLQWLANDSSTVLFAAIN